MFREPGGQPPTVTGFAEVLVLVPPLVEGASETVSQVTVAPIPNATAHDEKLPAHIPEDGQVGIGDSGLSKSEWAKVGSGVGSGYSPEEDLSMRAGNVFHGEARAALRGLSAELIERRREKRHGKSPTLVRGWAERSGRAMPQLFEQLAPGVNEDGIQLASVVVSEAELLLTSKRALSAVRRLGSAIVDEQIHGDGTPGPIELTVISAPSFQRQGERSGKYTGRLKRLPSSVPFSRKQIQRLTRDARTHMYIEGGDVLACPTSRPDILEFIHAEGDYEAENASNALAGVLYSRVGFNPEKLYEEEVKFLRKTAAGEVVEDSINMLDAVHWANDLIAAGRITPTVIDIKLQPHFGQKWIALKHVWEDNGNDLSKIFRASKLRKGSPDYETPLEHGYKVLKDHWNEMEWDVSATTFSFMSFLRLAEREFRIRNPGHPIIKWKTLANRVRAAILVVDFDISQQGEELRPRDSDKAFEPMVKAAAETAGIPADVNMFLRAVEPRRLNERIRKRGPEMRRQLIRRSLGKLAVLAA